MSTNAFKWIIALVITAFTAVFPNLAVTRAGGGSDVGGGDDIGLEFMGSFINALKMIRLKNPDLARRVVNVNPLTDLVDTSILVVERPLYVTNNGVQQDSVATNDRLTGLIQINGPRWRAIVNPRIKEGIALHEVLSLKDIEHTGYYPISGQYVAYFGLQTDTLIGGSLRYESPLTPDADQQKLICNARRRAGPQLLKDFRSVVERYVSITRNQTRRFDSPSIKQQMNELDQWIMDLTATRNCYEEDRDRDKFDKAIQDGLSIRVNVSAMAN